MSKIIMTFLSLAMSGAAIGETMNTTSPDTGLIVGLAAGSSWITNMSNQTINLQSDVAKTYTTDNANAVPNVELFAGWQQPLPVHVRSQPLLAQLGLSVDVAGNAKFAGDIWDDADSAFDNYNYNYKVNHVALSVKGRLIGDVGIFFQPYISASLGVGFNHAYEFTINPLESEGVAPPAFGSSTTTAFTYTVGAGLQKSVTKDLQVAVGYEFSDWGKTNLSRAAGQTASNGFTLNHIYTNTLQLSLFYIV